MQIIHRCVLALLSCLLLSTCGSDKDDEGQPDPHVTVLRELTLTESARIPENDPNYQAVEVFADRLVFTYTAPPETALEAGNVIAGSAEEGYLRRVVGVQNLSDVQVEVTTEPAQLTEFILDGAFRVEFSPRGEDWVTTDGNISGRSQALEGKTQVFTPSIFGGFSCGKASSSSFEFMPVLDFNFDSVVEIDIQPTSFIPPAGKLVSARFQLDGAVDAGYTFKTLQAVSMFCQINLVEMIEDGGTNLTKRLPTLRFAIGPVPVIITHQVSPVLQIQASASVNGAGLDTKKVNSFGFSAGATYTEATGWQPIWEVSREAVVEVSIPEEVSDATVSLGLSAGIQYAAFLYDTAGPKISLEGVLTGSVTTDVDACKWSAQLTAGINLVGGVELKIPIFDKTLADWTATANLVSIPVGSAMGELSMCGIDAGVEVPTACCLPSETCDVLVPSACETQSGTVQAEPLCIDVTCGPPVTTAGGRWGFWRTFADVDDPAAIETACAFGIPGDGFNQGEWLLHPDGAMTRISSTATFEFTDANAAILAGNWSLDAGRITITRCPKVSWDAAAAGGFVTFDVEVNLAAGSFFGVSETSDTGERLPICALRVGSEMAVPYDFCRTAVCTVWHSGAQGAIPFPTPTWHAPYREGVPLVCDGVDPTMVLACCNGTSCSEQEIGACVAGSGTIVGMATCNPSICDSRGPCYVTNQCMEDIERSDCVAMSGTPARDGTCGRCQFDATLCRNLVDADCTSGTHTPGASCL